MLEYAHKVVERKKEETKTELKALPKYLFSPNMGTMGTSSIKSERGSIASAVQVINEAEAQAMTVGSVQNAI